MQLPLRSFSQLVSDAAAAVQGAARSMVDLSVGSVLRALLEANAAIALWLQWIAVQVLAAARAATSQGADLDAWMADFAITRLPAVAASGVVTFTRYVPAAAAFVPVGSLVRSSDGVLGFVVQADTTNAAYDAVRGGFAVGAGVASVSVPVACDTPGAAGNVQAGAITLLASALPGIDTVANAAALAGGLDAESDDVLRARFRNWLASLSRATSLAVKSAVAGVQQGLQAVVLENQLPDGTARMGMFTVVVDDGTGSPSASLLASVSAAIEAVRPIGAIYAVQAPGVVPVTVSISIDTDPAANPGTVRDAVAAAITGYVDTLGLGAAVLWSKLFQVAYAASPAVTRVGAATLNGAAADLAIPTASVAKTSSVTVS